MSSHTHLKRAWRAGAVLAVCVAFFAIPVAAQASAVNLGTASPFVVLGGSAVTNTGPSVLNGDLGVGPGTSLTGFGAPSVVNGATHDNDAVANIAQNDLTTAYNVAAGQPVSPGHVLTGTNLGNRTLTAGAYSFSSSAQLTGQLTLDAKGKADAQFVFEIGSTLTTASASSVVLINGASPCNVYWQVGSSATLGTTTAFQGNLMALQDISLNNGASVIGRVLAKRGITLINNVLDRSTCNDQPTTPGTPGTPTTPGTPGATPGTPGSSTDTEGSTPGSTPTTRPTTIDGTATLRPTPKPNPVCTDGFRAEVRGTRIKKVVFSMDGKRLSSLKSSPFKVYVLAAAGTHHVRARVSFTDSTKAKTLSARYKACAAAVLKPRHGPSRFTG
jgi:type VI secretion system secreted protein VgrG